MHQKKIEFNNDYVLVVDRKGRPLMPCLSRRARKLRKEKRASIYCMNPFTIQIKDRLLENSVLQETEIKIDPGSKKSALVGCIKGVKRGWFVVWALHLEHRSHQISKLLSDRRSIRINRRSRKTRYRQPRFNNRSFHPRVEQGYTVWLPPSIVSRIENVVNMVRRFQQHFPVMRIVGELNKFDTQKMVNPEIAGIQYQHGTLHGFEVREYLLQKFEHTCVYCNKNAFKQNIRLEIDHVIPKSKGGSDRLNNLVLSCHECNQKKGSQVLGEFLKNKPAILEQIQKKTNNSLNLKDASHSNIMRHELYQVLSARTKLLTTTFFASQTKFNRSVQSFAKDHWIDAACVGSTGHKINLDSVYSVAVWRAIGRGSRQMCHMDRFGFPRTVAKTLKRYHYQNTFFQTGDQVVLHQPKGKYKGVHYGVVSIRSTGQFDIITPKNKISAPVKLFTKVGNFNGYRINFTLLNPLQTQSLSLYAPPIIVSE